MKRKLTSFVLLSVLILTSLIGIFAIEGVGAGVDLNYNFVNDNFFNSTNPISDDYNVKYQTEYTEIYNGSYSFTGETGLEGTDISFISSINVNNHAVIESNINNHSEVLNLTANSDYLYINQYFNTELEEGIFEFWISAKHTNLRVMIYLVDNLVTHSLMISLHENGNFQYYEGGFVDTGVSYSANQWYHFRLDFDCSSDYDWFVDGIKIGSNIAWDGTPIAIDSVIYRMKTNAEIYLDAFGFNNTRDFSYSNFQFDTYGEGGAPAGITWNGTHYFVLDRLQDIVFVYSSVGAYIGSSFSLSPYASNPYGITWDGNSFFIVDVANLEVYNFDSDGVYVETFDIDIPQIATPRGITSNSTHFLITDAGKDEVILFDSSTGLYDGWSFDISGESGNSEDVAWDTDTTNFWVMDSVNQEIYQYSTNGVYTGISGDISTETDTPYGLCYGGDNNLLVSDVIDDEVYEYNLNYTSVYQIGDNFIPYQMVYPSYEVDKWDFHYEGIGDAFEVGDDNPNGWTDIEDGGGDEVNIIAGLYYEIKSSGDESGTMKDDFDIDELNILEFSITFNVAEISQVLNNYVYFRIYSNDSTEIARIFFDEEYNFGYYNGSDRVNLATGLSEDVWYDFNLYIDYEMDLCSLRLNSSSSFIGQYLFPLFVLDKIGLSEIVITCPTDTGTTELLIDDIGVYIEGESITSEFGFLGAGIGNYEGGEDYYENWYFEEHNLLSLDLIGDDVSVYMYLMEQSLIAPIWNPEVIVSSQDWYGEETFNMYDFTYDVHRGRNYVYGGLLQFYIYSGTNLTLNEISMDGVRLNGTDGMFSLEYASGGVDELRNYFYVENNRLYYELITDDNDVEYMEATFDIVNHIAENRSISFKSDINGGASGYFRVSYTDDTSTFIEIPTHATETSYILSQERDIDKLIIIISDYDLLNSGKTTGYVYEVKLVYYPNISAVITTFDLIAMIIPLMILLIPTFAVYKKFGEVALIPMFMLMSVICFIANLIPAWLFFVLLLGSGALLFGKKRITESF